MQPSGSDSLTEMENHFISIVRNLIYHDPSNMEKGIKERKEIVGKERQRIENQTRGLKW